MLYKGKTIIFLKRSTISSQKTITNAEGCLSLTVYGPFCGLRNTTFSNCNIIKTAEIMNDRDEPLEHVSRGNFVQSSIIYGLIAFSRKWIFGENKTNNFVEYPQTLIQIFLL